MKLAYCVDRTNALHIVGSVKTDHFAVTFERAQLARLAAGELRPFVLCSGSGHTGWPLMPADLLQHRPTAQLWSNLRGKLADHRPQTWVGWPLGMRVAGLFEPDGCVLEVVSMDPGEPRPRIDAVLLRPTVPITKLLEHELRHDGFVIGWRSGARDGWIRKKVHDADSELERRGQDESARAGEVPGKDRAERKARNDGPRAEGGDQSVVGRAERRDGARPDGSDAGDLARPGIIAGDAARAGAPGDDAFARDDVRGTGAGSAPIQLDVGQAAGATRPTAGLIERWRAWVPRYIVDDFEQHAPPALEQLRVRVAGPPGVRGVRVGDELDAVRCPMREGSVWFVHPENGRAYRLNGDEWAPLEPPRRRARALDAL